MPFTVRHDFNKIDETIEILWIELRGRNKNTPFLTGVVYQPSSNEAEKLEWLHKFEQVLSEVYTKWDGIIILAGDFNIDLLNECKESQRRYKDILHSFSMRQHITKPTRKSKSLIDHIISTIPEQLVHHDILYTDEISDHDTPYVIFNIKKQKYEPRYKFIRNEKTLNMNKYICDFQQLPLSVIYSFDDPEDQVSMLNKLITDCINTHAPLKRVKLTRPIAPWMNDVKITNLQQNLISDRATYNEVDNMANRNNYRNTRNKLKKTIKETKANFLRKALSEKQPTKVWDTVNRILNKQHKRIKLHPSDLNNYFTTLASRLTNKTNEPQDFTNFFSNIVNHTEQTTFQIRHTNYYEVKKIILGIKNDCSTGDDSIPIRYLKPVIDEITSPMVHIINNCIDKHVFPTAWKVARVCPVPKIDHPKDVSEYRPISVLCILSKVFERVILTQLCNHIESHASYNHTQSGFRKGHSTNTLLLKLRDDIKRAMNTSEVTIAVLLDFSKAFDTIDHLTLLRKLHNMNFSVHSLKLIHSYLSERKQYVQVDDKSSSTQLNIFGVPQGSILGPVLFNLYIVDLIDNIDCNSLQYADDSTLYQHCKPNNLNTCTEKIENDLQTVSDWALTNSLVFNNDKTKYMVFSSQQLSKRHSLTKEDKCKLIHNDKQIGRVKSTKILGVHFDENLTWITHVNSIIKSSYATLRCLRRFKRFTPYKVRKTLAETLILSSLRYCTPVFSQLPKYLIQRLQRTQNTVAGYVLGRYAREHESITSLGWLPVLETTELSIAKCTFSAINDTNWPKYLTIKFIEQRRTLRQDTGFMVERGEKGTFNEQAYNVFNKLPKAIREINNKTSFLRETKRYYRDKALARVLSL